MTSDWVTQRWGKAAVADIVGRTRLAGGHSSPLVERLELRIEIGDGRTEELSVLRKRATVAEVAALRALREVGGAGALPELLDDVTDADGSWLTMPLYPGATPSSENLIPDKVIDSLARVHAFFEGQQVRDVPVVDQEWWQDVCQHVLARLSGLCLSARLADSLRLVDRIREDPKLAHTLDRLPRTLVHGDMHAKNILVDGEETKIVDWGSALLGPATLDLASITAPGDPGFGRYCDTWAAAAGRQPDSTLLLSFQWATLCVNVRYLGFAAEHLGVTVAEDMTERARRALAEVHGGTV